MKMDSNVTMIDALLRGMETVHPWSQVACLSVWSRHRPALQIVASFRREHAGQIVSPLDVLRRRSKGDDHGKHFSSLRWFGCAQGISRSLCLPAMKRAPGTDGSDASLLQSLAEADLSAGGLGSEPYQELLPSRAIQTSRGTPRQETRSHRRSAFHFGHRLPSPRLKEGTNYTDLGGDFFDRLEPKRLTRYYVRRLERFGHKVTLAAL
jgi:hypothetical protein